MAQSGALFYGDNLDVMRRHVPDESVDLVYLDPPFNSNANYNVLFAEQDGSRSAAQVKAFGDTWRWDKAAAVAFEEVVEAGGETSKAMQAFRKLIGPSNMLAYLSMMAPRLVELRRVLKPEGSIYLHCDPTASHYLKLLMDSVFGGDRFLNEVIWFYKTGGASKRYWSRKHDSILFYSKTGKWRFSAQKEKSYLMHKYGFSNVKIEEDEGGAFTWVNARDVWDIPALRGNQPETLGYPTQKPVALLKRIIEGSCPEDGVVLDPFCGCGTTIDAAQRLGRRWIGIDITHLATNLIKNRLLDKFGEVDFSVVGEPTTLTDAKQLAGEDRYQFQSWALGLVGARTADQRKGPDEGVDGRLYFHEKAGGKTREVVISVKSGTTGVGHVRELRGVVEREEAELGLLITLRKPTPKMRAEAATAGYYRSGSEGAGAWGKHPRLQILTVAELLDGRRIDMPPLMGTLKFPAAPPKRRIHLDKPLFNNLPDVPNLDELLSIS
ncbi:MAG: site-specific DNA-methyltransferase [Actinobacteria bacterium]|nr:MAG: site-specific DNA-methyltransferase [Actinomycetota bacterium]